MTAMQYLVCAQLCGADSLRETLVSSKLYPENFGQCFGLNGGGGFHSNLPAVVVECNCSILRAASICSVTEESNSGADVVMM